MSPNIVVIGAGVIGLSCALELQQAQAQAQAQGPSSASASASASITILARDFPTTSALIDPVAQLNYTSPWGGAHNRWVPPPLPCDDDSPTTTTTTTTTIATAHRDHALALATFHQMRALHEAHPEAGITFMKGIEYLEAPVSPEYLALAASADKGGPGSAQALGLPGLFRLLRPDELPPPPSPSSSPPPSQQEEEEEDTGSSSSSSSSSKRKEAAVALGFEYDTWCVNPMVYCAFLLNRFVSRGGRVLKREIRDPREVWAIKGLGLGLGPGEGEGEGRVVDVVVNASGAGFGDDKVFITRGQTCLIANRLPATITRQHADGTWTFCVPRNFDGGTIIGGTKEPDNWDPTPSLAVRQRLLDNFRATYPALGEVKVLQDVVGRRPTRHGGARIEREEVDVVGSGGVGGGGGGSERRTIVHAYGLGGRGYEMSWGVAQMVRELVEGGQAGAAKARL